MTVGGLFAHYWTTEDGKGTPSDSGCLLLFIYLFINLKVSLAIINSSFVGIT